MMMPMMIMMIIMMMMMMMNCFCGMVDRQNVQRYFHPKPLSEIFTIVNLENATSRAWTCVKPEFKLSRMKLCSNSNPYTRIPQNWLCWLYHLTFKLFSFFLSFHLNFRTIMLKLQHCTLSTFALFSNRF